MESIHASPEKELQYLQNIMAESRLALSDDRKPYLLWGLLLAIGLIATYLSVALQRDLYIGFVWMGIVLIGLGSSIYYLIQQKKRSVRAKHILELIQSGGAMDDRSFLPEFDYPQLDELIHSRIRLAIMAVLVAVDEAEFTFLRDKIGATDGNLSIHLKKLEEAGYVTVTKQFVSKKPVTSYKLSRKGRKAFEVYLERLEAMIPRSGAK